MHLAAGAIVLTALSLHLVLRKLQDEYMIPRFRLAKGLASQGQGPVSIISSSVLGSMWEGGRIQNPAILALGLSGALMTLHMLALFWLGEMSWVQISLYVPLAMGASLFALCLDLARREGQSSPAVRGFAVHAAFILILSALLLRIDLRQPESWIGHIFDILAHVFGFGLLVVHSGLYSTALRTRGFPAMALGALELVRSFFMTSVLLTKTLQGSPYGIAIVFALTFFVAALIRFYEALRYPLKYQDREILLSEVSFPWIAAATFIVILGSAT